MLISITCLILCDIEINTKKKGITVEVQKNLLNPMPAKLE